MPTLTILCRRSVGDANGKLTAPLNAGDLITIQTNRPDYVRLALRISSAHFVLVEDEAAAATALARTREVDNRRRSQQQDIAATRQTLADEQTAREERWLAAADFVAWLKSHGADRFIVSHILAQDITSTADLLLACEDDARLKELAGLIGDEVLESLCERALAESDAGPTDGDSSDGEQVITDDEPQVFADLLKGLGLGTRTINDLARAHVTTAQEFVDLAAADPATVIGVYGIKEDNLATIVAACEQVVLVDDEVDD